MQIVSDKISLFFGFNEKNAGKSNEYGEGSLCFNLCSSSNRFLFYYFPNEILHFIEM